MIVLQKDLLANFKISWFTISVMKIENNYSLHFGAKFINKVDVSKLTDVNLKKDGLSIAKMIRWDENDIKALEDISKWENDKYAWHIYKHVKDGYAADVYLATTQKDNFEKLDSNKIVGIAQISRNHILGAFLDYFQVKPDVNNKGIGSAILDSLKNMFNKICLMPLNDEKVIKFYEKNDFFEYPKESNFYVWYKDILTNIETSHIISKYESNI